MNLKRTFVYSAVCIIAFSLIITATYNFSVITSGRVNNEKDNTVVVLDAGHGGEDGGAVSVSGVVESELNLKFTKKLKSILNINGFQTVMTREDEGDLADKSLPTISERKKSDMYKRLDIYNSDIHNVAISIHQNIYPAVSCTGSQVFYSTKVPTAQTLAQNITSSIVGSVQKDNIREPKPTGGSIFLLDNATVPAVIVECGFLSNEDEVKVLCDVEYQKKISYCIFCGFMNTEF
ncbi:MAG: N-acetylmuramoyl-L-alanine amidase [Ruminococcus sp.]|nr:N-acetylmuramoyl-L-alanine amidase [Ruminococcus sp.]